MRSSLLTAVDQLGHRLAELPADFGLRDGGVLHHVVQQRGSQCLRIEVQLGQDVRDRERMRNIGIARRAELAVMRCFAELVRGFDPRYVLRLEIAGPFFE
jgi:hypothetical protein